MQKSQITAVSIVTTLILGLGAFLYLDHTGKGENLSSFISESLNSFGEKNSIEGTFKCDKNEPISLPDIVFEKGNIVRVSVFGVEMAYNYVIKNDYVFYTNATNSPESGATGAAFKVIDDNTIVLGGRYIYRKVQD